MAKTWNEAQDIALLELAMKFESVSKRQNVAHAFIADKMQKIRPGTTGKAVSARLARLRADKEKENSQTYNTQISELNTNTVGPVVELSLPNSLVTRREFDEALDRLKLLEERHDRLIKALGGVEG